MPKPTYADLEIRIQPKTDTGYPVELELNHEQQYEGGQLDPSILPWLPTTDPASDSQRIFEKFEEALALDPSLEIKPEQEATRLAVLGQFEQARDFLGQSGFDKAGDLLAEIVTQTPSLPVGIPVTATAALTSLWHFTGTAGQFVTISLVDMEDGNFDPYLTLIGPNGETIFEDDDSGGGSDGYDALIQAAVLPEDGIYFILAGRAGSSVVYELVVTNVEGE